MRQRRKFLSRRPLAVLLGAVTAAAVLSAAPAGAQNISSGQADGVAEAESAAPVCDIELDVELVNIDHTHANGTHVDHRTSGVIKLSEPVPPGRVLASGLTTDLDHLEDEVDFTTEKSQFEEVVRIVFLNGAGETIATTDATPDLPDVAPFASFALPSVELAEPAVAIEIVHAATGAGHNSVGVPCVNLRSVGPDSAPSDYVQHSYCQIDGLGPPPPEAACGFLAVPENRDVAGSRLINIAFAIFPGDGTTSDPLVFLDGGPGGAPIWVSSLIQENAMGPAAGGRDVIYVDQRGTGYAWPNLACDTQETIFAEYPSFEAYMQACHDRLDGLGVDLNGYDSVENGHDIADLRIALGINEWNLYGVSYGTDLGLTIMRDRPEGVRSVVLDSVFPPEVNPGAGDQGIGYLKQLDAIVTRCLDDPACGSAFPDLRNDLIAAVDNLTETPIPISGTEIEILIGEPESVFIGSFLLEIMNFDQENPYLPALLNGLASADGADRQHATEQFFRATSLWVLGLPPEIADELRASYFGVPGNGTFGSEGFFWSVICAEEYPFEGTATSIDSQWSDTIIDFAAQITLPNGRVDYAVPCGIFDVEPQDVLVTKPVVSDLPTLVLYTDNDWQTVPEWSILAASHLTNAQLVFFPNLDHGVVGFHPCPRMVMAQFLDGPEQAVDTSCTADLPPISYVDALPDIPPLPPIDEFFDKLDELLGPPPGEGPESDGPPEDDGQPEGDDPPADDGATVQVAAESSLDAG